MPKELDEHGQPNAAFGSHRVMLRSIDEMLGICKGVLCDGKLPDVEVVALDEWLISNRDVVSCWPGDYLFNRLQEILADAIVDEAERQDLKELLEHITGGAAEIVTRENYATQLFPKRAPAIFFEDHSFCFTGRFAYGPRIRCEKAVVDRGGVVHHDVLRDTQYLVIGTFGSRDWLHSTHGLKIQKAISKGVCSTVSEGDWVEALSA